MDIFKLGDKILALLEAVFWFWNNQISGFDSAIIIVSATSV